jgi:hypothetical protein
MVGRHHDQRVLQARVDAPHALQRRLDRVVEVDHLFQRILRVRIVQRMVDLAAFDHQEEAVRVPGQQLDRFPRHLGQGRLGGFAHACVIEVAVGVDADELPVRQGRHHVGAGRGHEVAARLELGQQVAAVGAALRIGGRVEGREVGRPPPIRTSTPSFRRGL